MRLKMEAAIPLDPNRSDTSNVKGDLTVKMASGSWRRRRGQYSPFTSAKPRLMVLGSTVTVRTEVTTSSGVLVPRSDLCASNFANVYMGA
jgi:hypothetical protein